MNVILETCRRTKLDILPFWNSPSNKWTNFKLSNFLSMYLMGTLWLLLSVLVTFQRMSIFVRLLLPLGCLVDNRTSICKMKFHNQIEPKRQWCADVELTYGSNEYLSNAYKWQFSIRCMIWVMLIVEDPSVIVEWRGVIKTLFLS